MTQLPRIARSFGTHDGTFHADEVTACALLLLFDLIDRDKIIRSRDLKLLSQCEYLCDVGGVYDPAKKRYDHHQLEYQGSLSSAGMVWKDLLEREVIHQEIYDFFNRALIWGVDAHDNGHTIKEPGWCLFSHVISNFVPARYDASKESQEAGFFAALDFVLGHLKRLLERFNYVKSCKEKVAEAMKPQKRVLIFEESIPWLDSFFELGGIDHPATFVVMPSEGHWKLRGIPPSLEDRMQVRVPLPEKWGGLLGKELEEASGIPGAVFCHKGLFVSVWETKEAVFKALDEVLKG